MNTTESDTAEPSTETSTTPDLDALLEKEFSSPFYPEIDDVTTRVPDTNPDTQSEANDENVDTAAMDTLHDAIVKDLNELTEEKEEYSIEIDSSAKDESHNKVDLSANDGSQNEAEPTRSDDSPKEIAPAMYDKSQMEVGPTPKGESQKDVPLQDEAVLEQGDIANADEELGEGIF